MTIGLQNSSVYWLTMQSSSVAVIADVPITIASSMKVLWQEVLAASVRTI